MIYSKDSEERGRKGGGKGEERGRRGTHTWGGGSSWHTKLAA